MFKCTSTLSIMVMLRDIDWSSIDNRPFFIAPSRLIVFDMLCGSVERIISSNPLLRFLQWIRLLNRVIWKRQDSYSVEMQVRSDTVFLQQVVDKLRNRNKMHYYFLMYKKK